MDEISNLDRENRTLRKLINRAKFLFFLLALIGLAIIFQVFKLTIIETSKYSTKSDENRIIIVPIYPSRGLIKLSDEEIVVENLVSQSLTIKSGNTELIQTTLEGIKKTLNLREEDLTIFNKSLNKKSSFYEDLVLVQNLNQEQIARYVVEKEKWPNISLKAQLVRFNVFGPLFSHVIGYIGPVSLEEKKYSKEFPYPLSYKSGKTGVEKTYEGLIRGVVGYKAIEVDAYGQELRELERVIPKKAQDLYLSLDKDLQMLARSELAGRKGAIIALDPNNGLIKALVSSPDFNPNIFNGSETGEVVDILNNDQSPIFNRALSGNYPPASTLKPFLGLLGLEKGVIDWSTTIQDEGFFQINGKGRKYRGWKEEGHGTVNLQKSIVESSDVFFYNLASQLTIESISDFLELFGFGSKTGIDLYAETDGILPDRQWKLGAIGESWFIGDTINLGIGQGYISCSPLQLAVAMSVLATRGKAYKPRVIERIDEKYTEPELIYKVDLSDEKNWQKLEDSMSLVISAWNGTAHNLTEFGKVKIAGKTGTAQIKSLSDEVLTVKEEYEGIRAEETSRDHALFIGYGPISNPKLAVVVIVENGESGSIIAAPIAQKLIDLYLGEKL